MNIVKHRTLKHRRLKSRTAVSHAWVCELGNIRFFNVTSAKVVRFLSKFVHIIIQVNGTMAAHLVIKNVSYINHFITHDTLLSSDFTCITRYMTYPVFLYNCSTDCCVTSQMCSVSCQNLYTYSYKHVEQWQ